MLQSALNRANKPVRMIVARLDEGAREPEVLRAADAIRSCVNDGDLTGRLGPYKFGVLSPELDIQELSSRITNCQPPGTTALQFRWSDWQKPAGPPESMEKLIAGAELLFQDSCAAGSPVAVH